MQKSNNANDVLKLVRAGGIVELYKHPIKANQVMERYPRHCVTRPDFFKFPNIVVKPESTLKPGQVYYIVPYHTVYRLLESKGYLGHRKYKHDQHESNNQQTNNNSRQIENIDNSFFDEIIFKKKKQSKRPDDDLHAKENRDSNVLKPCLRKNQTKKTRSQQGPRVQFMLPDKDDDDEKWDSDCTEV